MTRLQRLTRGGWPLLMQLLAVAAVVVVPWWLNQRLLSETLVAVDWVSHSSTVSGRIAEVASAVRDSDRALVWLTINPERNELREQIAEARRQQFEGIADLQALVSDNPEQSARVAEIRVLLESRRADANRVLDYVGSGDLHMARELLASTAGMVQLRGLMEQLTNAEAAVMVQRQKVSDRRRDRFTWSISGFAALQLLFLSLVVGLAARQRSQRTELEQQSRDAQRRAELVFNTIRKPIALLDGELRVLQHNPAFAMVYAPSGGDLLGRPLAEIGDGAWDEAGLLQKLRDVRYLGRELWDHEMHQKTPSGERDVLVNASRVTGVAGNDVNLLLTAADVSAVRQAERQIRELNERLESQVADVTESNRELEAFSYSVSHDLRAPLRHIGAFADKLEKALDLPEGDRARHYMRVITDSAARMGRLIDDLLVYSRLGRTRIGAEPVDMDALVAEVRGMLAPEQAGRRIAWQVMPLGRVQGDSGMLRLVWQNLLGNALKYTAKEDQARIRVSHAFDAAAAEHVFTVADNGVGFDMAYVDKLFGVFQRLHPAEQFEGTGIGLANVRRIVNRHGGRVWAESSAGAGATFHFSLPERPAVDTGEATP
ncbi:MAG: CHASE3 domain-containing protein [Xanthomonadales bacterium]|nr:CHASE3 domain-containing protein [Xanthomonadales bacterium]